MRHLKPEFKAQSRSMQANGIWLAMKKILTNKCTQLSLTLTISIFVNPYNDDLSIKIQLKMYLDFTLLWSFVAFRVSVCICFPFDDLILMCLKIDPLYKCRRISLSKYHSHLLTNGPKCKTFSEAC